MITAIFYKLAEWFDNTNPMTQPAKELINKMISEI